MTSDLKYRKSGSIWTENTPFSLKIHLFRLKTIQKVTIFEHGHVGGFVKTSKVRNYTLFRAPISTFFRFSQLGVFQGGVKMMRKVFKKLIFGIFRLKMG